MELKLRCLAQAARERLPTNLLLLAAGCLCTVSIAEAQSAPTGAGEQEVFVPRAEIGPAFPFALRGSVRPGEYLGVVGPLSAWLGFENGVGEVWTHPIKVVRDLRLRFSIPQYADPVEGTRVAREVVATPGHAVVSYGHEAFIVKQHILAPPDLPGILMLLEVDAVVDLEIHVEFKPVLQDAWPGGFGGQYLYWDQQVEAFVLSESLRERNAVIGSPRAAEAAAHPAHRLAEAPSVFVIPVEADRAANELIPVGIVGARAPRDDVLAMYQQLLAGAADLPRAIDEQVSSNLSTTTGVHVDWWDPGVPNPPDPRWVTGVVEWAKLNLTEQKVCNPDLGCGLVAGWGPSGTSFRPGFGWFFGGDAAINTLAMDAVGQWDMVKEALRFLARYQRADGKIPHEISQAAGRIRWFEEFPYAYYHADTTPYWMLALWQYWRASGDEAFVRELWPAFQKAYTWCLSVETDGDGIIENTTGGLGAIEVGGLGEGIHQDIYLASVWVAALDGTADMADALGDPAMSGEARSLFLRSRETLNRDYWRPSEGYHAFGILRNGQTNDNLTAWPSTALSFGLLDLEEATGTLSALAGDAISSSWGARLLSTGSELYDPLHYNNGMVWPFMTGFVAWGQFRYRRPWAGYPLLEALWRLHDDWSLGRHPENLSGAFYHTLDATVPHQFFASSMLLTPLVRGLLGWDPDAPRGKALLAPQPHPAWSGLRVENLSVGETRIRMEYRRVEQRVEVQLESSGPDLILTYRQALPLGARNTRAATNLDNERGRQSMSRHDLQHELTFTMREGEPVHLSFRWDGGLEVYREPNEKLARGSRSGGPRILDFSRNAEDWVLVVEGESGQEETLFLRGEAVDADIGSVSQGEDGAAILTVPFPPTGERAVQAVRLRKVGGGG
jgi:hypothetical protein